MLNSNDVLPPAFPPATQAEWMWRLTGALAVLATALVIVYMTAGLLQWRSDAQAQAAASAQYRFDQSRADYGRAVQVGQLR